MIFKTPIRIFAFSLMLSAILSTEVDAKNSPPLNLLIITADDMNGDSWFDSKVGAAPNLDAFARASYRFEHCHVSAPICQPSRSALMTGRVPHRNGALGFDPVNLDVPTLTEVLTSNGYFSAVLNKGSHMMPRSKFNWDLNLDGSGKNPMVLREQFEQCLKNASELKKPFFINANITDPHRPFAGNRRGDDPTRSKKNIAKNEAAAASVEMFSESEVIVPTALENIPEIRTEVAEYFSSVRRLDQSFGELMAALKVSGHEENTIIVFLSDHGMSFPFSKATLYHNGTSSPLLIHWPGLKKPFNNVNDMVSSVDIMPSVLELMEIDKPSGMDGRSFVPLLNRKKQSGRDHVFTHVNTVSSGKSFAGRCVRTKTRAYIWNAWPDGTTRYKVEAMSGLSFAAMEKASKENPAIKARVDFFLYRTAEEFYDEEKDPGERRNVIDETRYQKEIAKMRKLLLAHMKQTNDPLLPQFRKVAKF